MRDKEDGGDDAAVLIDEPFSSLSLDMEPFSECDTPRGRRREIVMMGAALPATAASSGKSLMTTSLVTDSLLDTEPIGLLIASSS